MQYTTETVTALATQVANAFTTAFAAAAQPGAAVPTMATLETQLRELLRQVGQQTLSTLLSRGEGTPVATMACACGGTLHYQRQRPATVVSVFGKMTYTRPYYAGCACGHGLAPRDVAYGLTPGAVTSGLASLLGLTGIAFGFAEGRQWVQQFLLFDVAAHTIRAETQTFGQLQQTRETAQQAQSQSEAALQARVRAAPTGAARLYGSIDAAKVRIEPRVRLGERPTSEKTEAWRDLKVGCWYEVAPVRAVAASARERIKLARDQVAWRATTIHYYCDIAEASLFGEQLWSAGVAANADVAQELVFVCDGAVWIWHLVEHYFPKAVQIVDWFHAEEHLERVAQAAFPNLIARAQWLDPVTTDLWEGRVADVLRACEALAPHCAEARQAAGYFQNNAERMRYDQFRAAGYVIGSGTVESACKQIVARRLKVSGAQWNPDGAVLTAKARAAYLSGDWQILATARAALPLAV